MPTIIIWIIAASALALAAYFWRKAVNLKESFEALKAQQKQAIDNLQAKVAAIPDQIVAARIKGGQDAVAAYIAANPPVEGGAANVDGLEYQDLVDGFREIGENTRNVNVNADIIPVFFDGERVHGNPNWPNPAPGTEAPQG